MPTSGRCGHGEETVAVDGGQIQDRRPGQIGRTPTDLVDLDVIGMAVATVLVVDDEHVGVLLTQEVGHGPASHVRIGGREGAGVVVGRLAGHARVVIAEEDLPVDAEDATGLLELGPPAFGQRLALGEQTVGDLAELAAGGSEEDHPVPVIGEGRHGPGGGDGFVVRVGVEEDHGGHRVGTLIGPGQRPSPSGQLTRGAIEAPRPVTGDER